MKISKTNIISKIWQKNKSLFIFVLLMSVFRSAFADWYTIPSGSMLPTIEIGDRIVVNKMAYDFRIPFSNRVLLPLSEPQRGDIIVFDSKAADIRLIKRVVALPGDRVSMVNEQLTINGILAVYKPISEVIMQESINGNHRMIKLDNTQHSALDQFSTVTVPDGHYLVLGDNRRNSADSRVYGFVPRNELLGKASHVAFSLNYDNGYLPRSGRYIKSLYK
ncbi:signal peptidase I [Thalassotalea piscium]